MELQQRQDDGEVTADISQRVATGELYALKWDRNGGKLLAIAGPFMEQDIARMQVEDIPWQSGPEIAWATNELWEEKAVVKGETTA